MLKTMMVLFAVRVLVEGRGGRVDASRNWS